MQDLGSLGYVCLNRCKFRIGVMVLEVTDDASKRWRTSLLIRLSATSDGMWSSLCMSPAAVATEVFIIVLRCELLHNKLILSFVFKQLRVRKKMAI